MDLDTCFCFSPFEFNRSIDRSTVVDLDFFSSLHLATGFLEGLCNLKDAFCVFSWNLDSAKLTTHSPGPNTKLPRVELLYEVSYSKLCAVVNPPLCSPTLDVA